MLPLLSATNRVLRRRPAPLKSFALELGAAGPLAGRSDAGLRSVPTDQIVGSVGRAEELRPDFTFRRGPALTARHRRIARAMRAGQPLPPLELYALAVRGAGPERSERREYYVVDGHHRVAMARRLGQEFVDAHVVEYRVAEARAGAHSGGLPRTSPPPRGGTPCPKNRLPLSAWSATSRPSWSNSRTRCSLATSGSAPASPSVTAA